MARSASYTDSKIQAANLEAFVASGDYRTKLYGTQWAGEFEANPHLVRIRDEWIAPVALSLPRQTVLEIGAGGGRWSRFWPIMFAQAILVDGTAASETAVRQHCDWPAFTFIVSPDGKLPAVPSASVDYVFSFDTFVHFEPALFAAYVAEIGRVLRAGGVLHLHFARLWPENTTCDAANYKYRDETDVAAMLAAAGMTLTSRRLEIRSGNGGLLVEAVKHA